MNKAEQILEDYKKKYNVKYVDKDLFAVIFANDEVTDEFLDFYGNKRVLEYSDWEADDYVTVWVAFFQHTRLSAEKIDRYISNPAAYNLVTNSTLTTELIHHLFKNHKGYIDEDWTYELLHNSNLTSELIKENIDFFDGETITMSFYGMTLDLAEFLLKEDHISELRSYGLANLSEVTLDFVVKYQDRLDIYALSENAYLNKEIAEYLIENFPSKVCWTDIFDHVEANLDTLQKYWSFISEKTPIHMLLNSTLNQDAAEFLLEKINPQYVDWEMVCSCYKIPMPLYMQCFEYMEHEYVLKNKKLTEKEREELETYYKLKTLFN